MRTYVATTPRQFQGIIGQYVEDVVFTANNSTQAARRYALDLVKTSSHPSLAKLRAAANGKALQCFKTRFINECLAYVSVGFIADDGSKVYIPFEFCILEDRPPVACDPNLAPGL